jgi:hypothetical protein
MAGRLGRWNTCSQEIPGAAPVAGFNLPATLYGLGLYNLKQELTWKISSTPSFMSIPPIPWLTLAIS